MKKIVTCPQCGAKCQYNNGSNFEGNREMEDIECPACGYVIETVFIDHTPTVLLAKEDDKL